MAVGDEDVRDLVVDERGRQGVAVGVERRTGVDDRDTPPRPMMYVPVPRYVNFDGFSATTRRTSGLTCSGTP